MPQDRAPIPLKTIKLLFAQSGNRCAFPGCTEKLTYNDDTVLAEICHIQGYSPDSARYNPAMTDKERNSLQNLVLMCAKHHTIIDTHPDEYPTERLCQIKHEHEAAVAADRGSLVPHTIPPPPADFTGRAAELASLLQSHSDGACISGMHGLGGIGKSALAFVLAEKLAPHYPDGQLMLDMLGTGSNPLSPADALRQVIQAWHPTARLPEDERELRNLYLSVLNGKRVILLLDNARGRAQVEPLIPPRSCLLLVTSRWHFALPGLKSCNLEALDPQDAIALLCTIAPRLESVSIQKGENHDQTPAGAGLRPAPTTTTGGETPPDNATIRKTPTGERGAPAAVLAALCEYLPLALRLTASALAEQPAYPIPEFLAQFQDVQSRLGLTGMDASLQISYDLLSPDLQQKLRFLSVFPAPFERPAAAAVWQVDEPTAQPVLDNLVNASLLDYTEDAGFRLHDLMRDFVGGKMAEDERYNASLRHAAYYLNIAAQTTVLYEQGGEHVLEGLRLFDRHWEHARQGQAWVAAQPDTDQIASRICNEYPNAARYCVNLRLHPEQWIAWLQAALAAACRLGEKKYQGYHLGNLGIAYGDLGQVEKAIDFYHQALVIAREIGDRRGEGADLGNLGLAYANLGQVEKAIEYYQKALAIDRENDDRHGEAADLGNLGIAYGDLGQVEKAIEYHQEALEIDREIGDRQGEGNSLGNLGIAYADLGQVEQAIGHFQQALAIDREIGDRRNEENWLGDLGNAYFRLGQVEKAIDHYQQALVIACEIDDRRGEGKALGSLGNAYRSLGQVEKAIDHYKQALTIARETGDRRGEGIWLGNLALTYEEQAELARAVPLGAASLAIRVEIKMPEQDRKDMEVLLARLREKLGEAAFQSALAQAPEP